MTKLGHVLRPQILVNDTPDFSGVRELDKGISPPFKGILHIYKSSWVTLTIPPGKRLLLAAQQGMRGVLPNQSIVFSASR